MAEWCGHYGVDIRAYCLMANHVHLIASFPMDERYVLAAARYVEAA